MTYYIVSMICKQVSAKPADGPIDINLRDPEAGILGMMPVFASREQAEAWRGDSDAEILEATT